MNILVLGAGMYVTGRQNTGVGTLLAALTESSKTLDIEKVTIVARSRENNAVVMDSAKHINEILKTSLNVSYVTLDVEDEEAFSKHLKENKYTCAIISLPDHLHFVAAKIILEHKIHCLVVKPLTPTLTEAQSLLDLQRTNNVYAAVEFHKRFDETNLITKKLLQEKKLGGLLYFTVDYSQRIEMPKNVFAGWSDKTNIFQYLGVHYVDLIYFLTGFIPKKVSAVGTEGVLKESGIDTYDSVHAQILSMNPDDKKETFVSQFNINWIDPNITSALSDQKYKVVGTKGRIECDQKNRGLEFVHEDLGIQQINPYFAEYLENPDGNMQFAGYGYKSISLFLRDISEINQKNRHIAELEQIRPSFKQALISTAVIDSVNKSLKSDGKWEIIDDIS